jgi:CubicO group peptidase (beta-lactamase class C family)
MATTIKVSNKVDFSREEEPRQVGMRSHQVAKLVQLFESQITKQRLHPAAQLVVLRHGKVALDRAIGTGRDGKPIDHHTPFYTFSTSKPFMGICIHKLIEDGKVALDERISTYWPEFGCKGKESATIRHALLHQAGIPAPHRNWQVPLWLNWALVTRAVAGYQAVYPPGKKTHYHLVNFGFILGEVVRRVTGMMPDVYFETYFSKPLGLERTWMRIPWNEIPSTPTLFSYNQEHDLTVKVLNLGIMRHALIPAASIHSNARGLAVFYQMLLNGGVYDGKRLLKAETITKAVSSGYHGYEEHEKGIENLAFGFFLGGKDVFLRDTQRKELPYYGSGSSEKTFGHYGLGSCMAWADPGADIVVAFTTNGLWHSDVTHQRWADLNNAVWDALI